MQMTYYYVLLVLSCEKLLRCVNGTDVSTCEKTIHLEKVLTTTNKCEMVFDGIKKFYCSVNRFMSEFGSLQTVIKNKLFHQLFALYGSQLWPLWHDSVNKMCIK